MSKSATPPKGASLLLRVFASDPDFQQIEGDLIEEFHHRLLTFGPDAARRWYWREAFRNLWVFLMNRPGGIQVLVVAAPSAVFLLYANLPWIAWLQRLHRTPGLALALITVSRIIIGLGLGALVSRWVKRQGGRVRVAITGLYALIWAGDVLRLLPIHFPLVLFALGVIGFHLSALTGFWIGSLWSSRRSHSRMGA